MGHGFVCLLIFRAGKNPGLFFLPEKLVFGYNIEHSAKFESVKITLSLKFAGRDFNNGT